MSQPSEETNADEFYAGTYDDSVPDWPGEIEFYRKLSEAVRSSGRAVLEVACGTGRVAIRLAREGAKVVGLDLSPDMLAVARQKSQDLKDIRWVEGDMRSFELNETFNLALIPGHAFQNLNTPQDQVSCLECIRRHLQPGGKLVVHLDHMNLENMKWLGDLCGEKKGAFDGEEQFQHPETGNQVRASRAWTYTPSTQTATVQTMWEELDGNGQVIDRIIRESIPLHVLFRFEMEHLLARTGFQIEALYGDFFGLQLQDDSPGMIWVAIRP